MNDVFTTPEARPDASGATSLIAASSSPASRAVRAIGPSTPCGLQASPIRPVGTRPGVGRKPTRLQKEAG